jgi:hypothetical protein
LIAIALPRSNGTAIHPARFLGSRDLRESDRLRRSAHGGIST